MTFGEQILRQAAMSKGAKLLEALTNAGVKVVADDKPTRSTPSSSGPFFGRGREKSELAGSAAIDAEVGRLKGSIRNHGSDAYLRDRAHRDFHAPQPKFKNPFAGREFRIGSGDFLSSDRELGQLASGLSDLPPTLSRRKMQEVIQTARDLRNASDSRTVKALRSELEARGGQDDTISRLLGNYDHNAQQAREVLDLIRGGIRSRRNKGIGTGRRRDSLDALDDELMRREQANELRGYHCWNGLCKREKAI